MKEIKNNQFQTVMNDFLNTWTKSRKLTLNKCVNNLCSTIYMSFHVYKLSWGLILSKTRDQLS